jgi:hypothetical protein
MKTSALESGRELKLEVRLFRGGGKPRRATCVHSPEPQIGVPAGSILVGTGTTGVACARLERRKFTRKRAARFQLRTPLSFSNHVIHTIGGIRPGLSTGPGAQTRARRFYAALVADLREFLRSPMAGNAQSALAQFRRRSICLSPFAIPACQTLGKEATDSNDATDSPLQTRPTGSYCLYGRSDRHRASPTRAGAGKHSGCAAPGAHPRTTGHSGGLREGPPAHDGSSWHQRPAAGQEWQRQQP